MVRKMGGGGEKTTTAKTAKQRTSAPHPQVEYDHYSNIQRMVNTPHFWATMAILA
jgi:hypothetical protein